MRYRDRILATIKGEKVDCLPFVPRLDLWYKAQKYNQTLPERYRQASLLDICNDIDVGFHCTVPDFLDIVDPSDNIDRALGIWQPRALPYRVVLNGVKRKIHNLGDVTVVEYLTPYGNITTKVLYDEEMRRSGVTISHILEHAIKSVNDFNAVAYIFENAEVVPSYDQYLLAKEEIGHRGVAVGFASLAGSPMHLIQRELMPYQHFFLDSVDHLKELNWLAGKITPFFHHVVEVVAQSPAEIIFLGANYDATVTYPPFFEQYIAPTLSWAADTVHKLDKYLLTHTDGENKGLLKYYLDCKIDIADSICPKPMTSLTLSEVRQVFDGAITIWGGIPSTILLKDVCDDEEFEAYLDHFFEEIGSGDHLILGISDTTPPAAEFSRIEKIAKRAKAFSVTINP